MEAEHQLDEVAGGGRAEVVGGGSGAGSGAKLLASLETENITQQLGLLSPEQGIDDTKELLQRSRAAAGGRGRGKHGWRPRRGHGRGGSTSRTRSDSGRRSGAPRTAARDRDRLGRRTATSAASVAVAPPCSRRRWWLLLVQGGRGISRAEVSATVFLRTFPTILPRAVARASNLQPSVPLLPAGWIVF